MDVVDVAVLVVVVTGVVDVVAEVEAIGVVVVVTWVVDVVVPNGV